MGNEEEAARDKVGAESVAVTHISSDGLLNRFRRHNVGWNAGSVKSSDVEVTGGGRDGNPSSAFTKGKLGVTVCTDEADGTGEGRGVGAVVPDEKPVRNSGSLGAGVKVTADVGFWAISAGKRGDKVGREVSGEGGGEVCKQG